MPRGATGNHDPEVLIVGGGPAGASTAFQLVRRGVRVLVLERARFPRSKPCGECLSPQASRLLHDMGVLADVEANAAHLRGIVVRSPSGAIARGDYVAGHGFRGFRDTGLSIRREILDQVLLNAARGAGAVVEEGVRVSDVVRDGDGTVRGVLVVDAAGTVREVRAGLVVAADGLRSVIARRVGLSRVAPWPHRVAIVAHYRDVGDVSDLVEIHVEDDGFVGVADVGGGATTVAAVFPRRRAHEFAGDAAGFLGVWLKSKPHLRARFERATREEGVAVTGPFASHSRRPWTPGALLVGDAADFFDPATGEGIHSALRGGELAADAAVAALSASTARHAEDAYRAYAAARRSEFGGKWRVERLVGLGVAAPAIMNRAVRSLAARKPMADLLAGVTGDFVPPNQVLRLGFLARLMFPAPQPAS
jgi:flavin-dependent dehydrogenase